MLRPPCYSLSAVWIGEGNPPKATPKPGCVGAKAAHVPSLVNFSCHPIISAGFLSPQGPSLEL